VVPGSNLFHEFVEAQAQVPAPRSKLDDGRAAAAGRGDLAADAGERSCKRSISKSRRDGEVIAVARAASSRISVTSSPS